MPSSTPSFHNNILNFNTIKKQSTAHKHLEMLMRDSLDNIEEFGFQMFLKCDVDSIDDFEISPHYEKIETVNLKAQA